MTDELHPLVTQLHFARSELQRCLAGVTDEEARRRFGPMNCISWIVGHLAEQENRYWVFLAQGDNAAPELRHLVGYGQPASTPPLEQMWAAWQAVTTEADRYLQMLTPQVMQQFFEWQGKPISESIGTLLQRNLYHYWFHAGEAYAIRQLLGHTSLPDFVGSMTKAAYRPE